MINVLFLTTRRPCRLCTRLISANKLSRLTGKRLVLADKFYTQSTLAILLYKSRLVIVNISYWHLTPKSVLPVGAIRAPSNTWFLKSNALTHFNPSPYTYAPHTLYALSFPYYICASVVTTLWRYTNMFIIVVVVIMSFCSSQASSSDV